MGLVFLSFFFNFSAADRASQRSGVVLFVCLAERKGALLEMGDLFACFSRAYLGFFQL